jgi:hypothetical protein
MAPSLQWRAAARLLPEMVDLRLARCLIFRLEYRWTLREYFHL